MTIRLFPRLIAVFGLALLLITNSFANDVYARIRGTVTDASGAIVPDATVTATNVATNQQRQVTVSNNGNYEFINLPIGSYRISVDKAGFKSFQTTAIPLNINQVYVQDIQLQVGATTESVTVEADPSQVETTNTQLETVIKGDTIVNLPLNGRNWVQLQATLPGVVSASTRFGSNFATNGSQAQQNSYLVNGTDTNDLPLNTPLIIPSPDAIGEFNLVTNTINPEFGRNSGAILNAVIKNGTNSFHGSAFDFYRDTFLNSKNYFKASRDIFHQNQFGGTIGGPAWKDHTFFFFSYQGTRNRQPQTSANISTDTGNIGNSQVLTAAERGGLFPALATSTATSPFPLVGESGATFPANTPYSQIFPTGHIPAADINAISGKLLSQFVPSPNSGTRSFLFNPIEQQKQDQEIVRVDHNISQRDSIWASVLIQASPQTSTLPFLGADLPGFTEDDNGHSKQATASWNHVFNANMLNELRLGYTRLDFDAVKPDQPVLPSSIGFTGITPQISNLAGLPTIVVNGSGPNFSLGFSDDGPQPRIDQTYQVTDNFSKIIGNHSTKFGFDGRRFLVKNPFSFQNNGHFDFTGTGQYSTGLAGADFLLGIPDDYSQNSGGFQLPQADEYYIYAQDQWKVLSNLTLNYGLGWQVDTPLEDKANGGRNINCFIPGQQSTVFPTAPAGLNFPGDTGCTSSGYHIRYGHVGPRFGFAYSPDKGWLTGGPGKTSIRGGYGIYFNRSEEEITLQNTGTPPFGLGSTGIGDV
ncbi:MAG: carboxypeptidase regulatory-like domain-containing protein, partial [Acidobacteria bacterium]|nr:carboxypeptidase regulatory-like domain-containing protein [Acidobacteriota bacterium]